MKSLRHLNKYFLKYKTMLLIGSLFVIAQNFAAIYPAKIVSKSIDAVTTALKKTSGGINSVSDVMHADITHKITILLFLLIGVRLLGGVLMFLMRQTLIVISRRIEFDLKNEIYNHYQKLTLAFYRRNNTGDLMNRISEDVSRVRMYVGPALMYSINLFVLFVLIMISMLAVNARMTLYVLAPLPFLSISIYYVSDLMNKKSEQIQFQQSRLSTFVQEAFSGIRILKSYVKEEERSKEFARESESYKNKNMELVKINSMFFPLMLVLVGLSTLLTVYVGGLEVIAGRATTGNIAEFILYVNYLTWPMASLGWVTSLVQRAAASQQRINEFLHLTPEVSPGNLSDVIIKGRIEFRNVSFVYPDSGIKALNKISFEVKAGDSLAIIGRTGSGKSTIANLLERMYDVTDGKILIDDERIENYSLSSLREQIGIVPQDVFLFSDSISNNISFGLTRNLNTNEKDKLIKKAAQQAVIYDNIMEFPEGFETMIGERGITLSGGQKQRVSIARAIIKHPKILIFDDCLSAVDTNTENKILAELREVMKGRTSVIISHRVSSVKNAGTILVLDDGEIIEKGDHSSLMEKRGSYFELYEKQMLEEEISG